MLVTGTRKDHKKLFRKLLEVGYVFDGRTIGPYFMEESDDEPSGPIIIDTRKKEISRTNVTCAAATCSHGHLPITVEEFLDNFEALAINDDLSVYDSLIADELEERRKKEEEYKKKNKMESDLKAILSKHLISDQFILQCDKEKLRRQEEEIKERVLMLASDKLFETKLISYLGRLSDDDWKKLHREFEEAGIGEYAMAFRDRGVRLSSIHKEYIKAKDQGNETNFVLSLDDEETEKLMSEMPLIYAGHIVKLREKYGKKRT